MPQVGEITWNVDGDVGGLGVSRFRFVRQDSTDLLTADAQAAATATQNIFGAMASLTPITVTWTCSPECKVFDIASGLVQPSLSVATPPTPITGSETGQFGAGLGGRINWKTDTIEGRRLIRGATFIVPLGQNAYNAVGALSGTAITNLSTGAAAYLAAMTTHNLNPAVWHRPPKKTTTGGLVGIVFAGIPSPTPAGLRSRRS